LRAKTGDVKKKKEQKQDVNYTSSGGDAMKEAHVV
jgi:hypothetical protein